MAQYSAILISKILKASNGHLSLIDGLGIVPPIVTSPNRDLPPPPPPHRSTHWEERRRKREHQTARGQVWEMTQYKRGSILYQSEERGGIGPWWGFMLIPSSVWTNGIVLFWYSFPSFTFGLTLLLYDPKRVYTPPPHPFNSFSIFISSSALLPQTWPWADAQMGETKKKKKRKIT